MGVRPCAPAASPASSARRIRGLGLVQPAQRGGRPPQEEVGDG